jgi:hypothetical protein
MHTITSLKTTLRSIALAAAITPLAHGAVSGATDLAPLGTTPITGDQAAATLLWLNVTKAYTPSDAVSSLVQSALEKGNTTSKN